MKELGLRQQIENAKSESDVLKLLNHALQNLTVASEKTKRAWRSTAKRRLKTLNTSPIVNTKTDEVSVVDRKKKVKKSTN